ncbi:MAG: hypothetical protein JSV46_04775 [Candidatus Aminicenantes bacterium]|nr:MAG: hypothetical protein JSV46_04775 [Candidatus Aminicenantes bacterium]
MSKKLLVSVFLCFFVFSLGMIALEKEEEKSTIIELLFWYSAGRGEYYNKIEFEDPSRIPLLESEPILTFHVPPSPKSDALFFELGSVSMATWWDGYSPLEYNSGLDLWMSSEVIPDDISVYGGGAWLEGMEIINHPKPVGRPGKNTWKSILRRDGMLREYPDNWFVVYKSTGEPVPKEIANSILNDMMDNGFDVEVTQKLMVEGVKQSWLLHFYIDVTRATKK